MRKMVRIGKAADLLGYSVDSLRRWDREERLEATRGEKGSHRVYSIERLDEFSKSLDRFKSARSWVEPEEGFEHLPCYYCPDSYIFQARNNKLKKRLVETEDDKGYAFLVVAIVSEIGDNSYNHNVGSWPDIVGSFFSYDLQRREVVLADRGQGVLATLKKVRPGLKSHGEALETAFTEVISGRAPERRGNGLKFVRKTVERNENLDLFFQTGYAKLNLSQGSGLQISVDPEDAISGCLVKVSF